MTVIDFSVLYILYVLSSVLLFNVLVLLVRYVQQTKQPPVDEDFQELEKTKAELERMIASQKQEIVELEMKMKDLEASTKVEETQESLSQ